METGATLSTAEEYVLSSAPSFLYVSGSSWILPFARFEHDTVHGDGAPCDGVVQGTL